MTTVAPQLLVSVRSASEARAALAGGADIIDVKEPARGSLGMPATETIAEIVRCLGKNRPLSAALGEAREWLSERQSPPLPAGLTYCKLGLAGLALSADWQADWRQARSRVEQHAADQPRFPPRWIAVCYADFASADAPPPEAVIAAARQAGCAGVLFDTFGKEGRGLLDWLELSRLSRLIESIQASGMLAAVAGGLRREDVPALLSIPADVLAIRTAACEDGRNGTLSESAVRRFRAAMRKSQASAAAPPERHRAG